MPPASHAPEPVPLAGDDLAVRLEVLSEELAVADEELLAQQREIDALVSRETAAQALVRHLVRTVPAPVVTTDGAGAVEEANPAAGELLGLSPGRLVRKPLQAFVAAEHRGELRDLVSRAGALGSASGTTQLLPRDGRARHVAVAVSRGRTSGGQVVLHWVLAERSAERGAPGADEAELDALRAVVDLTGLPVGEASAHQLLTQIAGLTSRAIAGARWTSTVVGDPAAPTDSAADAAQAQAADGAQWRADEGPSAAAFRTGAPVLTADITADPRWPRLAAAAAGGEARGALGLPLRSGSQVVGVLTVYSDVPGGIGPGHDVDKALVFGDAASAVLAAGQRVEELRATAENLRTAMRSRAPIEQAKGVVATRLGCDVDEAFAAMSSVSQDRNVKVRDLAALVVSDPTGPALDGLLRGALDRVRAADGGPGGQRPA